MDRTAKKEFVIFQFIMCCRRLLFRQLQLTPLNVLCYCSKLSKKTIDFPEQMRFVNLQRLLLGLQTVKLSTCVSVKDEQVLVYVVQP